MSFTKLPSHLTVTFQCTYWNSAVCTNNLQSWFWIHDWRSLFLCGMISVCALAWSILIRIVGRAGRLVLQHWMRLFNQIMLKSFTGFILSRWPVWAVTVNPTRRPTEARRLICLHQLWRWCCTEPSLFLSAIRLLHRLALCLLFI